MASMIHAATAYARGDTLNLLWAFIERQINLYKGYWGWELVWLIYGVVNTLAITFIAKHVGLQGLGVQEAVSRLVLFLLIGTLVWAYLSAVLDVLSLVVTIERWEGTIEHTHDGARTPHGASLGHVAIRCVSRCYPDRAHIRYGAVPFFDVNIAGADWPAAVVVLAVGSISVAGLAILAGVLPLIYPERGPQMSFAVQAVILLVSGVYYEVEVLPGWLQVVSAASPATYMIDGMRDALLSGQSLLELQRTLWILLAFGVGLVPASVVAFGVAERWAKKTGRLKRQG